MKAHQKVASGTALIEVIQKAAELVEHDLPDEYKAMSSAEARRCFCAAAATPRSTTPPG